MNLQLKIKVESVECQKYKSLHDYTLMWKLTDHKLQTKFK